MLQENHRGILEGWDTSYGAMECGYSRFEDSASCIENTQDNSVAFFPQAVPVFVVTWAFSLPEKSCDSTSLRRIGNQHT